MSAALHQIAVIFIGILAGFVCRKGKVLSEEGTATVSNIVVKIILPFYLFSAILNSGSAVDPKGVLLTLGLSFGMFLLSGLVALVIVPLLRPPAGDRGVYLFETMCGNVTYIGIPVCAAVLGGNAAFYGSLLNIPYNLLCFSLGIWLLAGKLRWKKLRNSSSAWPSIRASVTGTELPMSTERSEGSWQKHFILFMRRCFYKYSSQRQSLLFL